MIHPIPADQVLDASQIIAIGITSILVAIAISVFFIGIAYAIGVSYDGKAQWPWDKK